ncbi:heat domain containing protein [Rhodobacteraceae bacterium KLH11]|nr:heat domain containing protein [Rhodobacteraceae bacterium KLH11]
MAQNFSLKDQLFNAEKTSYLAGLFANADPGFDAVAFEAKVMSRLPELELKERMAWIAACLQEAIPGALPEVAPTLLRALPPPLDPDKSDDDFGDFIFAPLGDWVCAVGLDHPSLALDVLEELTQRFSMEWAIRPFLNHHPDLVLERMRVWCDHPSYHVRRLVSEGTRPRLPWGQAVGLALSDPLPLLDRLQGDQTRYVTRSVANHLNDITKKDPDLVLERLRVWNETGQQDGGELQWMTAHALRGLVKSGHAGAMKALGYDPDAEIAVDVQISGPARIGEALTFETALSGDKDQPVLVDYIIHFQRPGGKISPKVHKLKQTVLEGGTLALEKRHRLKGNATTFKLVPGPHRLEIQVNGRVCAGVDFELLA